jgi:1-acyl-sn-glycerol-3-phosphate acyltransferase
MSTLFSLGYWTFAAVSSFFLYLGALLIWAATMRPDPTRSLLHRYTCWWGQLYLRCLPGCRVRVEGREKIKPHTAYVLVANHQSAADILALSSLSVPFKWISKKENFRIPFVGWNMSLNEYLRVEPGNPENVQAMMESCKGWLRLGVPILWFPEGQRSPTGELLPFHGGAFRLAAECACAVVPVVVEGTLAVFPDWRVAAYPGLILIRVLDPIALADAGGTADSLRDHIWKRMKEAQVKMREDPKKEQAP